MCCNCSVAQSFCRLLLHHVGSIALGSFIIVLVKIPRYFLMYLSTKCVHTHTNCGTCIFQ